MKFIASMGTESSSKVLLALDPFLSLCFPIRHVGWLWQTPRLCISGSPQIAALKPHLSLHPFECPRADSVSSRPRTEDGEGLVTPWRSPHLMTAVPGPQVLLSPVTALLLEGYFDWVKLTLWGKEHKVHTIRWNSSYTSGYIFWAPRRNGEKLMISLPQFKRVLFMSNS